MDELGLIKVDRRLSSTFIEVDIVSIQPVEMTLTGSDHRFTGEDFLRDRVASVSGDGMFRSSVSSLLLRASRCDHYRDIES